MEEGAARLTFALVARPGTLTRLETKLHSLLVRPVLLLCSLWSDTVGSDSSCAFCFVFWVAVSFVLFFEFCVDIFICCCFLAFFVCLLYFLFLSFSVRVVLFRLSSFSPSSSPCSCFSCLRSYFHSSRSPFISSFQFVLVLYFVDYSVPFCLYSPYPSLSCLTTSFFL